MPGSDRSQQLDELTFLAEVARLAASARTWDELMGTIIDRARAAARADVCSLYLMDRDGTGVTLGATNGLDQHAVGVARLRLGQGITGLVARDRVPITTLDVKVDPRFAWIRGVDQARFTSMCSVPLLWNDQVVGVLNVQTVERRDFSAVDVGFLETLAGLLAGLVEKHRLQDEAAAQLESLRAIDEARANLVAVVTHALRTPLAVVRAYVELLGGRIQATEQPDAAQWEEEALNQVDRLDRTVDSILEQPAGVPQRAHPLSAIDIADVVDSEVRDLAPMMRRHSVKTTFTTRPLARARLRRAAAPAPGLPAGERVQVRSAGGHHRRLRLGAGRAGVPRRHGRRARHPRSRWHERIFEPFVRLDDSPRGAGIGLFAARHLARSMGGDLRVESRVPAGSQFVLELRLVREV